MKAIIITSIAMLLCFTAIHAQSVKDVMQDKSGTYIYAQARDTDIKVAYETANSELLKKVKQWCTANGVKAPGQIEDVQAHIHRINGEVSGQHRVFLFITTSTLRNEKNVAAQTVSPDPIAAEAAGNSTGSDETQSVAKTVSNKRPSGTPPDQKKQTAQSAAKKKIDNQSSLPEGRLGEIIGSLIECNSEREILEFLARCKNSRGISSYGKGDTKYARHAFLVGINDNHTHILSPELSDGSRIDYETGSSVASPGSLASYIWFLKK